ncbi:beta-alanine-activating enzyme isoform X2 [Polyergus mexicanus]|uniref:beta-alanine-activating enzyme isoform X2 n=1 Tax=Polyergus mexicanus TaxID=615972 RepID=UPI0038B66E03
MSRTINDTKRLKLQDDNKQDCQQSLYNICSWLNLNKTAIEYHDLKEVKIISYNELRVMKEIVSNCLKRIQHPEFIGINLDILEYCVPSLMLGILDSGHAFFNVPADSSTYKQMLSSLHVNYVFMKCVTSNKEIICQFNIHGQPIYLTKLINVQGKNINRRWYRFAYAVATSGSTGIPKIVKVLHSCILPNIIDLRRILYITNSDKIAQLTNFTFDPSIVEVFLNFSCTATLFMVSKPLKNEADRFLEEIFHAHVTVLQITPSLLFNMWTTERLKTTILDKDSQLRVLLLGGEPFPSMKLILKASHLQNMTRLFNIYGITEISCWSSINEIARNDVDESYLGEPLSETIFQIRNEDNEMITSGEGTLYIGSINRICIIENEIDEDLNKPIFRSTGDIVSIDDRGRIFYKGRRNNIIKRFGNKVNLWKLEKVVTELNFIRICSTFWDAKSHKLYLCVSTTKPKEEFLKLKEDIMAHLKILPTIYKPDKIIIIDDFNFTTSGKICHASLKKICQESETEIITVNDLCTDAEEIFRNLWNNHVKSKGTGFLTSGGTSIAALQISSTATEAFNAEFPELIDKSYQKMFNAKESVTRQSSSNNSPSLSNKENFRQWYKCRGKIYSNILIQEESTAFSQEKNISSIKVLATYNLQKCIDASPIVYRYSKTELYATVGSHFGIICTVDLLETNNRSYEIKLPDRIEASVLVLAEFRGIVGCYDGYVYCVHLKTGEIIWKFQTQDMVKCTAITCPQGSKIFVGSYDHYVYCLSIEDGTQIWKTEASESGICATGCLHRQSTSVLFGTLDGSCLALQQSSGQITWKHKLRDPIFVAPVVLRTKYVLFCSVAGALYCFDIETGCQMWRYAIHGNVFSYPVIWNVDNNEYVILASHNKHVYCLEMPWKMTEGNEPKLKYTLLLPSPIFATPWCEDGRIFVACTDGILKIFDLSEGKLLAIKQLPGETFSSPVVHNDLVVLGCRDNNLYVLRLCAA